MIIAIAKMDNVSIFFTRLDFKLLGILENDYLHHTNLPVWKTKGSNPAIVSSFDHLRLDQVLKYNLSVDEVVDEKYIYNSLHKKIKKINSDHYIKLTDGDQFPTNYIFAQGNKIFKTTTNGSIMEIPKYVIFDFDYEVARTYLENISNETSDLIEKIRNLYKLYHEFQNKFQLYFYEIDTKSFEVKKHII
jgi:hypothetical protein